MKNLKIGIAFLFTTILCSCLDTEEKIIVNADNSGTYSMTIDLGRMLKMAGSMGADTSNGRVKEKKDTTIYLKDMLDTAKNLTPAERALYKDGVVHVNLDEANSEMKIVMSAPFKNFTDLREIKNNLATVVNKLKAFEKATGEKEKPDNENDDMKMGTRSANPVGDQFTFAAVPGKISSTITDVTAFKKLVATDSTLSMMSQMTGMMGEFNYRTVIVLPKVVNKYTGPGNTVSADKKTITFVTTLTEMLEHPEKVSYTVEY
ncbi:MAG: hypothetical protein ABIQ31_00685 [Ferruginibacter sp.]